MHDKIEHIYFKNNYKNDSKDYEADVFASILLIPKKRIEQAWQLADYNIEKLAQILNNFPKKVILMRLLSLEIIV
ncbi:hypothetical protein AVBRAN_1313 [Campylobacter sp. RM12651]|nr:hypothetical protein AVBRAN_1313 [Campylobacter sp. RM12651]